VQRIYLNSVFSKTRVGAVAGRVGSVGDREAVQAQFDTRGSKKNVRVPPSLYIQVYRAGSPGQILGSSRVKRSPGWDSRRGRESRYFQCARNFGEAQRTPLRLAPGNVPGSRRTWSNPPGRITRFADN
jgi:hypothetical protein